MTVLGLEAFFTRLPKDIRAVVLVTELKLMTAKADLKQRGFR